MRLRACLSALLLIVGLLAQAAAVVRHGGMVVQSALAAAEASSTTDLPEDLARDLAARICHPAGDANATDAPSNTRGDGPSAWCPICNGLAAAYVLPAPSFETASVRFVSDLIEFPARDERVASISLIRPQSRGPPSAA